MEISQIDFFLLLLYSFEMGLALGFVYDVIKLGKAFVFGSNEKYSLTKLPIIRDHFIPRKNKKSSKWIFNIFLDSGDFLFMIFCAIGAILVAYIANSGKIRWMIPCGMALGIALYTVTIGKATRKFLDLLIFLIRAIFLYLYLLTVLPLRFIINIIGNLFRKLNKNKGNKNKEGRSRCRIRKKKTKEIINIPSQKSQVW